MNIFYLDHDPYAIPPMMVDRHIIKMILESAQMLSTAHRIVDNVDNDVLYKATHVNHPSTKWIRESKSNYNWLYHHFCYLGMEYNFRYGKIHKSISKLSDILRYAPKNLVDIGLTKIPCAMPQEYIISEDSVVNYRNYYIKGKSHLHKWTKRTPPEWISS